MEKYLQPKTRRIVLSVLISLSVLFGLLVTFADINIASDSVSVWKVVFARFSNNGQAAVLWTVCVVTLLLEAFYLLLSVNGILSLLNGKKGYVGTLYAGILIFLILMIIGAGQGVFRAAAVVECILNILLCAFGLVYHYACVRFHTFGTDEAQETLTLRQQNGKLILTVSSALSCVSVLGLLVTPFIKYTEYTSNISDKIVPIESLGGAKSLIRFFVFLGTAAAVFISLSLLVNLLGKIKGSVKNVFHASRALVYCNLILSVLYYLSGYIYAYVMSTKGTGMTADGYAPIILAVFFALLNSIVCGQFFPEIGSNAKMQQSDRLFRAVMLGFTFAFTVCTMLTLLMNIVVARYSYTAGQKKVVINGIKLLQKYAEMSKPYRTLAFVILTALALSLVLLLISLMSYIGRSRVFNRVSIITVTVNVLGTTVVGICGKYFEMVQGLNTDVINELLGKDAYLIEALGMSFKVTSDAYVPMLVSIGLLVVLLLIAPVTHLDKQNASGAAVRTENTAAQTGSVQGKKTDEPDFDACPAFTELDGRVADFEEDLNTRTRSAFEGASLPDIVRFIVRYAADCRLHLSYREEEIADFISGLGATRLTILQGMSGTGKTSLPKIAAEALMGNCDIIEVESSWRDKNELLGYYNEFSKTYTPRKFTQALYKAKLNPDIPTFIVLDEMNLSRIEYYFSDFLSLMENEEDKREIKLLNVNLYRVEDQGRFDYRGLESGHTLRIPRNVWFIGTANRDESTFAISDKVYDRAHTMNFRRRAVSVTGSSAEQAPRFVSYAVLSHLLEEARTSSSFDIEQSDTIRQVEKLLSPFNVSFGNRVARQIETYVKTYIQCFRDPEAHMQEALENILLSEVVSKLENKTVENKSALAAEFDKLGLHRCAAFVLNLNEEYL